jgi:hypothetical protein
VTEMDAKTAATLRAPFPPEVVGKLPRVWCGACRDSKFKVCDKHQKVRCDGCRNSISTAHLHLDYVGHAEVTDRLLQADPLWQWEPVAWSQSGLPLIDDFGGMWIRLTVAGVTRLGYGHAEGKKGPDAVKETIGDALRNAAMRFGVALDLWGATFKEGAAEHDHEGHDQEQQQPRPAAAHQETVERAAKAIAAAPDTAELERISRRLVAAREKAEITPAEEVELRKKMVARYDALSGPPSGTITDDQQKRLHVQFNKAKITDRHEKLKFCADVLKREVKTSSELSQDEAEQVITELKQAASVAAAGVPG